MAVRDQSAGGLLRRARQRAQMSQVELARRAGTTQSVVSAYESGAREPSLPMLRRLVAAAGFEIDTRLHRTPDRKQRMIGPLGRRVLRHQNELRRLAASHGVSHIRVFGSVARGEESDDSDIDLLIDIAPDVGLLGLGRLQRGLEEVLRAPVDLVPEADLKAAVRRNVTPELVEL